MITIDQIVAVFNSQFDDAQALAVALQLLAARMDIEMAHGVNRLTQGAADAASQQAQAAMQAAQANALAAQARFDQIVASIAAGQ